MSDDSVVSLQPGTIIGDRYEVVKCLGAGSMGLVYACKHTELSGHMVAVKVLFPEVAQDKVAAARFRNEVFASYEVSHPNVVRAYEYVRDKDLVAYTMEYVPGGDLADKIGTDEPLPVPEIIRLLIQMCSGVQAIHNAGIIHRDLKPENILLTKEGNVKIADFGIARTGHGPKLTEHGGVVGTIDYVSPEYMLNSQVDWRSDIYAIGILAYELIAGESPFRGDSVYATMTKRLKTDPAPPSSLRRDCPSSLDSIVLKAMARNPEDRYQSAADMEADLRAISSGAVEAPPTAAQPQRFTTPSPVTSSGVRAPVKPATIAAPTVHAKAPVSVTNQTQIVPPEMVRQATGRKPELKPPPMTQPGSSPASARLESVLQGTAWPKRGPARDVKIGGGSLDEERMQRLAQLAATNVRSLWLDMITIIFAVLVGIGIGCVILKVWFPDLLKSKIGFLGQEEG